MTFKIYTMLLLAILLSWNVSTRAGIQSESNLPDNLEGKVLKELFQTISSGEPSQWEKFIVRRFTEEFRTIAPMEFHIEVFGSFYEQSRGYNIYDYSLENEHTYIIRAQDQMTGLWGAYFVSFAQGSPGKINGFQVRTIEPPSEYLENGNLNLSELATEMNDLLDNLQREDVFSGTVLLAHGDEIVLHRTMGFASKRFSVPNQPDTKFNLGSMNKMFTAIAIAQLEETDRLAFDDPIGLYLDSTWVNPETGRQVTVAHLLSHTSGLGSYFTSEFTESSRILYRNINDYKPLVSDDSLRFKPGTDWHYSNTGFLLLGAIIETITEKNYFDYVRENINKLAGMINTDAYPMDEPVPNLAIGYEKQWTLQGFYWKNNIFDHVIKGTSAGGGFSTALDLLKFSFALQNNTLVSEQTNQVLTTPKPEFQSPNYGFGFDFYSEGRAYGHTGGFTGINSALEIYPDEKITLIVLSNYSDASFPVRRKFHLLMSRYQ